MSFATCRAPSTEVPVRVCCTEDSDKTEALLDAEAATSTTPPAMNVQISGGMPPPVATTTTFVGEVQAMPAQAVVVGGQE